MDTELSEITNGLLLNASWLKEPGIFNGKMGVVLYFSYLNKHSGEQMYEYYANQIFAEIINDIYLEMPIDFSGGLSGISWAINLLIANGLTQAEEDVLDEFDQTIVSRANDAEYVPEQTAGLLTYCVSRLRNLKVKSENHLLYQSTRHAIGQLNERYVITQPQQFDITWPYPWILWQLNRISYPEPLSNEARNLRNKLLSQADSVLQSSRLHPGNRFFLYLILHDIGYATLDLALPSDWLQTLDSPSVGDGFAGVMLLLTLFSGQAEYYSLKQEVTERLSGCISPESPYVYDLKETPPQHCFGLLHGISGIGLVKLLTCAGNPDSPCHV